MPNNNESEAQEPGRAGRTSPPPPLPIVGIGASAGGIDALKAFFSGVPADCGFAFVVVQHLDPDHRSMLADLLGRAGPLPVDLIKEDTEVQGGHVYVIPPNATLTIREGRLHLAPPTEGRDHRTTIDAFFISLAAERGEHAACVILSGTGSDGTRGLRAIKEHGGLTLAQMGAEYDGMMRSAVATGLVDFVLPAQEIAPKLVEYFPRHADRDGKMPGLEREGGELNAICALLRARTGHDFSGYKEKTLVRRIQRRMQVLQIEDVPSFLERLRQEPREIDLLFHDLLIGVTNFFRDPEVFHALEETVIPRLFEGKGFDDTVRVWVAGCATGEEAYSIAMLLRERAPKWHEAPRLQVFASDIDDQALEIARVGRYPASVARDVSPERLQRFFVREDGTYRVTSDLRQICLFSVHNLLHDAPFSKLDLISCRNLMIYLKPELQNRLVPLLHYALRDNGFLLLGTSENVGRHGRMFSTYDKVHHIFRRRPRADHNLPEFPLTPPDGRRRRIAPEPPRRTDGSVQSLAERQLLDNYAPAYVIADAEGEVLHVSGRTGKYLELAAGAPTHNIFTMARQGLRIDLRAAFHRAVSEGETARHANLTVGTNGGRQAIDLIVQPIRTATERDTVYMVVFQDVGAIQSEADGEAPPPPEDATMRQLEAELRATKERLQTATEELESSNEELKSGNEELSSINEELQSANEELETSKEELQSINEELQTVNAELKARVDELSRANSDIANLLESTQIATVFLDGNLAIKSFTPAAKQVFRLIESDTGRPISHVRSRLKLDSIEEDAERVLRTLAPIEKHVASSDSDARYLMRMLPYRTVENVIAGVVLTFIDVTQITAAEGRIVELTKDLRNRAESVAVLLDLMPASVFMLLNQAKGAQRIEINRQAAQLLGETSEQKEPFRLFEDDREIKPRDQPLQRAARTGEPVMGFEGRLLQRDGHSIDVMITATPLFDSDGNSRGAIAAMVDVSSSKRAESAQVLLLEELQHRVKNVLTTVSSLATRMLLSTPAPTEFAAAFLERLRAMGSMHELLAQHGWESVALDKVVAAALAPFADVGRGNLVLQGPSVPLKPDVASTLGMALHELAGHGAKHGALSVPAGRVQVAWELQDGAAEPRLQLTWREERGPAIQRPEAERFETGFVKRSIEQELGGALSFAFDREGLLVSLEIPLREGEEPSGDAAEPRGDAARP